MSCLNTRFSEVREHTARAEHLVLQLQVSLLLLVCNAHLLDLLHGLDVNVPDLLLDDLLLS